jgi:hypothetical protein
MSVRLCYCKYSYDLDHMLARPDTDVEISIQGGNRNYKVCSKLNALLIFMYFKRKQHIDFYTDFLNRGTQTPVAK